METAGNNDEMLSENELSTLEREKGTWAEVVKRFKTEHRAKEKELNDKIAEIYSEKIQFFDEVNDHEDQYGISSPWWRAQMLALHDPLIGKNAAEREHKGKLNHQILKEIEKMRGVISDIEGDVIATLKKKMVADGETLLEIEETEQDMKLQAFGSEFQSLRADVQANKDTCKKLELMLISRPTEAFKEHHAAASKSAGAFYADLEVPQRGNSHHRSAAEGCRAEGGAPLGPELGIVATNGPPHGCQVFKMYEKTTFVYKKHSNSDGSRREQGENTTFLLPQDRSKAKKRGNNHFYQQEDIENNAFEMLSTDEDINHF